MSALAGGAAAIAVTASGEAALAALLEAAQCGICHALYDTPLVLRTCGHSFCSSCIRHSFEWQERSGPPACPSCRKPCDARDLLPNPALREVVDKLAAASPLLASLAKQTRQQPGRKRPRQQRQQAGSGAAAAGAGVRSPAGAHGSSCEEIDLAGASSGSELPSSTSTAAESDDGGSSSSSADLRSKRRRSAAPRHPGGAAARQQQQPPPPQQQAPGTMVTAEGGGAPLPGFVRCPVCNKAVPAFYINSHVDQCLAGGQEPAAGVGGGGTAPAGRQKLQQGVAAEPFEPLAVPVKLVPNLASERSLRQLLKRYSLPTDGKKKELLDRYTRMRLAVETANDKQERTTYAKLAKRVLQPERSRAAAQLLLPAAGRLAVARAVPAAAAAAEVGMERAPRGAAAPGAASSLAQAPVTEFGMTFKQLIAVTRMRDAERRADRAAAGRQQQQQQQAPIDAGPGSGQEEEGCEDDSERLWRELPLSQSQLAEWQQRRAACRQQQEQRPPNGSVQSRLGQSSAACLARAPELQPRDQDG